MSHIPLAVISAPRVPSAPVPPEAVRLVRLAALMNRVATGALLVTLGVLALTKFASLIGEWVSR